MMGFKSPPLRLFLVVAAGVEFDASPDEDPVATALTALTALLTAFLMSAPFIMLSMV
jgi:hypothetical protein